jgi:hypothetical protein
VVPRGNDRKPLRDHTRPSRAPALTVHQSFRKVIGALAGCLAVPLLEERLSGNEHLEAFKKSSKMGKG